MSGPTVRYLKNNLDEAAILSCLETLKDKSGFELNEENQAILAALRRSSEDFKYASVEEIGDRLSGYDDAQIAGLISNVKGIAHEMQFVSMEYEDGDSIYASLSRDPNHPDFDVQLIDTDTGALWDPQLKTTDDAASKNDQDTISALKAKIARHLTDIESRDDLSVDQKSDQIIHIFSAICAAVAVQPIPFADIFVLTPIQAYMAERLAAVRGISMKESSATQLLADLAKVIGLGVVAQQIALGLYKTVLPFLAGFTTIPLVYGLTYAIGKVLDHFFIARAKGKELSPEEIKAIWDAAKKEGERKGKEYQNDKKGKTDELSPEEIKAIWDAAKKEGEGKDKEYQNDKKGKTDELSPEEIKAIWDAAKKEGEGKDKEYQNDKKGKTDELSPEEMVAIWKAAKKEGERKGKEYRKGKKGKTDEI